MQLPFLQSKKVRKGTTHFNSLLGYQRGGEMSARALVGTKTVREMLSLSDLTLWRLRKNGTGPDWCRVGSRILYDLDSVNAFVNSRMVRQGETEPPHREAA